MKGAVRVVGLFAILLAIVAVRVVWSSRGEWRAAEAATGEPRIVDLGRAARLYAPGNPFSRRALDALADLGRAGGADSLTAWQEVRSAILATRSFYTPHPELLAEANQAIAQLMAERDLPSRGSLEARRAWHASRLAKDDAPSVGWSLIALLGLGLWIGAAILFILRALDENDQLRPRWALALSLGLAFGLMLFFVGLARA
jgi:hypothetical protein